MVNRTKKLLIQVKKHARFLSKTRSTRKKPPEKKSQPLKQPEVLYARPTTADIGIVKTQIAEFKTLEFSSGGSIKPLYVAYETYGTLNKEKSNAVLVCHALSGDAHAAGIHSEGGHKGWWNEYIGSGKAISTDRYFVICSNIIGWCQGSTGPSSLNPKTNKPYGTKFPIITIKDMVAAQSKLIQSLGIQKLLCVAGGSMGGMQVLEWSANYPSQVQSCICIASTSKHSPMQIAFNEVGRQAIMADPKWNNGDYYQSKQGQPRAGLSLARMIGHITYLSEEALQKKFARKLQDKSSFDFHFDTEFEVESYLRHQGKKFVFRFDANSYLYITRAIDYFDLADGYRSIEDAFKQSRCRFLFISFSSDWLYPPAGMRELARAAKVAGREATYLEIDASQGHDAFLLPSEMQTFAIQNFLSSEEKRRDRTK